MSEAFTTSAEIAAARQQIEASIRGYVSPAAFGVGVATISANGDVLDVAYPHVHAETDSLAGAALAGATGHHSGTQAYRITAEQLHQAIGLVAPAESVAGHHPNLAAWRACLEVAATPSHGGTRQLVAAFIGSLDDAPTDAVDAYLRLHLLSHRVIRPHQMSMDGIFGVLSNVVWTNLGPFAVADFELTRMRLRSKGHHVVVFGVDKFPRMVDYVIPAGVRIADGARVRLGAHLAAGTTVMHEGFCNFNAGTLGASMVEGRISAGVLVGDGTDIGGGASIMGTLSGGGQQTISLGSDCLLGANSGLGISLGNDCIVEAGLYLTAGTLVAMPDGTTVKAHDISGADGLLFRRNSVTGAVEALARSGASWHGLNTALHDND